MFVVPMWENSVWISMISNGCLKAEFDSTYPVRLNGIISQEEFRESINKINLANKTYKKFLVVLLVLFILCMVAGMIVFPFGIMALKNEKEPGFSPYFIVGIVLTCFGPMLYSFGLIAATRKRTARLLEAIAEESRKYSSRSPTPCSWKLETGRHFVGTYARRGQGYVRTFHQLVIDIGRPTMPTNQVYYNTENINQLLSNFGQQFRSNPPAYSAQPNVICHHCTTPRKSPSDRFCSSCGQSFEKY